MDHFQFYPTGYELAKKMWGKFVNKNIARLLEPSAGNGDLLAPIVNKEPGFGFYSNARTDIDAIELDIERHAVLRSKKINVVGFDFLEYQGTGASYSHIIMNPPFAEGVKHVLKAWDILFDGEIVAIINAESIRNPFSAERKQLLRLIEDHGDIEYMHDGFISPDTKRKTEVEIALVTLPNNRSMQK